MPRARSAPLLAVLAAALLVPGPARAASPVGGDHDPPGTRASNLSLGFPEIAYQLDLPGDGQRTHSLRAGVLVWPLAVHLGYQYKGRLTVQGKVTLSGVVSPLLYVGFFGGTRATYTDTRWGRSRSFLFSLGPGVDVGLQASARLADRFDLTVGWNNPVVFWAFFGEPFQWYVEWPVALSVGGQARASDTATFFGKVAAGPSIVISGATQQVGIYFQALVGIHLTE